MARGFDGEPNWNFVWFFGRDEPYGFYHLLDFPESEPRMFPVFMTAGQPASPFSELIGAVEVQWPDG